MKKLDFYFDLQPKCLFWLPITQRFSEKYNCEIKFTPVLLGGIFKSTNNKPPMEQFFGVLNKNEYQSLKLRDLLERHKLTKFKMNPHSL